MMNTFKRLCLVLLLGLSTSSFMKMAQAITEVPLVVAGGNTLLNLPGAGVPFFSLTKFGTFSYSANGDFSAHLTLDTAVLPPFTNVNDYGSPADHYLKINMKMNASGSTVTGVTGDDLVLYGSVDTTGDGNDDAQGVLLTGEVVSFGYADTTSTDSFDFRFQVTGGLLASFFNGNDIAVRIDAEESSFNGDFTEASEGSFVKGTMQPTSALCMNLTKQVSVDGGATWLNADNVGDSDVPTLITNAGDTANYQVIAENCGGVELQNAVFNDATLGITNYSVGTLAVGASVTIDSGSVPEMAVANRCSSSGNVINSASIQASSTTTPESITESDTAVVECISPSIPSINLSKQISVDGGATWHEADDVASAPNVSAPHGAEYRFVVENNGTIALNNVFVTDAQLPGFFGFIPVLAAGQTVILDKNSSPSTAAAAVVERCLNPGTYPNTAVVSATSTEGDAVTDSDTATLVCTGTPGISILKEIKIEGGDWEDAKNVGDADVPETLYPSDAEYRFTVSNTGNTVLTNVNVSDATIGVVSHIIPSLAVGQTIVLTQGDITALYVANRCTNGGTFTNSVSVVADVSGGSGTVSDSDTSVLECIADEPGVKIVKEISTNGIDWLDANDAGSAPTEAFPSDAEYRFTVSNTGDAPLINVVINDAALNITNYVVGNLPVLGSVVIDSGDIPAMNVMDRCDHSGTFTNIARVDGESAQTGISTTDDDPAVLVCIGEPNIELVKEVSVDGGNTWHDANASGDADVPTVTFPHAADYRLTVRNTGTIALNNVTINDGDLGVVDYVIPGEIAVDGEVVIGSGEIPALSVATRCDAAGEITNTALVSGTAVDTGNQVNAGDSAVMECVGSPHITVLKQISLDGTNWADADAAGDADVPHANAPSGAHYRFIVRNDGTSPLTNVTVNDAELNIVDYVIGDMAIDAEVTIDSGNIAALDVAERCSGTATVTNIVDVTGESTETGASVGDSDPAVLICTEVVSGVCDVDVDLTATFGDTPPPVDCAKCDGKITALTLRYNGASSAFIVVEQKRDAATPVFSGTVEPNSTFSFVGQDDKGTLSTEITISVDGNVDTTIHTSCSVDVLPGMTFGSFTVTEGTSRNGGNLCPISDGTTSTCDDVTYTYTVTNSGDPVDVLLEDDTYDLGLGIFQLGAGASHQVVNEVCVPADTTNTASVTATLQGNGSVNCADTASVSVYCADQEVWVQHCTNSSSGGQQCSLVKETQKVCSDTPPPPPPPACDEYIWVQHCTNSSSGGQQCSLVKEKNPDCPVVEPPACHDEDVWVNHCTNSSSGGQNCSLVKETKEVCDDDTPPPPPACHDEDVWVNHCTNSSSGGQNCSLVKETKEVCDDDTQPEPPVSGNGTQGCTPGYWKQKHHFDSWSDPYDPKGSDRTMFVDVFEDAFPDESLRSVLRARGGGVSALGRHTVAALLNAASSEVDYGMTPQQVIDAFNAVYPNGDVEAQKNIFNKMNEQGCPLN